jgi:hypothetical protein
MCFFREYPIRTLILTRDMYALENDLSKCRSIPKYIDTQIYGTRNDNEPYRIIKDTEIPEMSKVYIEVDGYYYTFVNIFGKNRETLRQMVKDLLRTPEFDEFYVYEPNCSTETVTNWLLDIKLFSAHREVFR